MCEETFTSTDVLFYNALHAAKKAMHLHKGDNIVIETSMDRVRMELAKWSVMTNNTAQEAAQKARAEAQAAAKEKAAAKKAEKERKKNEKKNGL